MVEVDIEDRENEQPEADDATDFFGMSLDHLCVAGFDGYFKRVNPSWTRTLGWSQAELMARPSIELVHVDDREATLAARRTVAGGASVTGLVNRYQCKDGSYRWFEWRSVGHTGRGLVYAAARDVTEQKLAEARLQEAKDLQAKLERQLIFSDRMASVGTLAAGVAHEINNPLSSVTANVELLIDAIAALGPEPSAEARAQLIEMAADAAAGAERIRTIVLSLKTFSRAGAEQRRPIDIEPVLQLAIDMARSEIRHRGRLVKELGRTPRVDGDEARLGQVFINLLVNAAQALPERGDDEQEIRVVTSTDGAGRAVIEVRDTGTGIPPSLLGRIFDPFFTTKPVGAGTGLGLSICHNLVVAMGGEISVTSEVGRGTTFRVVLPATATVTATATAVEASAPTGPRRRAGAPLAVLVVDDESSVGNVLRRVLAGHDVTVLTAAKDALALLESGQEFDVILSDLMMPQMSGMDFHDALTQRFPHLAARVVFVSGGAFTPAASAFLERVRNPRITKPFDPRSVRELVQTFAR